MEELAIAYVDFLAYSLRNQNLTIRQGLIEARNKFLTNAYLSTFPQVLHRKLKTQYVSREALLLASSGNMSDLTLEHLVPKDIYIQKPCEDLAITNNLTARYVIDLLQRYWHLATITKPEQERIHDLGLRNVMPRSWNEISVFARTDVAGIELIENPFLDKLSQPIR